MSNINKPSKVEEIRSQRVKQVQVSETDWRRLKMKAVMSDMTMKDFVGVLLDAYELNNK